ncbi:hypothetical protein GC177_07915 [bacterium]|nr:hypothetical protein [bacterium]
MANEEAQDDLTARLDALAAQIDATPQKTGEEIRAALKEGTEARLSRARDAIKEATRREINDSLGWNHFVAGFGEQGAIWAEAMLDKIADFRLKHEHSASELLFRGRSDSPTQEMRGHILDKLAQTRGLSVPVEDFLENLSALPEASLRTIWPNQPDVEAVRRQIIDFSGKAFIRDNAHDLAGWAEASGIPVLAERIQSAAKEIGRVIVAADYAHPKFQLDLAEFAADQLQLGDWATNIAEMQQDIARMRKEMTTGKLQLAAEDMATKGRDFAERYAPAIMLGVAAGMVATVGHDAVSGAVNQAFEAIRNEYQNNPVGLMNKTKWVVNMGMGKRGGDLKAEDMQGLSTTDQLAVAFMELAARGSIDIAQLADDLGKLGKTSQSTFIPAKEIAAFLDKYPDAKPLADQLRDSTQPISLKILREITSAEQGPASSLRDLQQLHMQFLAEAALDQANSELKGLKRVGAQLNGTINGLAKTCQDMAESRLLQMTIGLQMQLEQMGVDANIIGAIHGGEKENAVPSTSDNAILAAQQAENQAVKPEQAAASDKIIAMDVEAASQTQGASPTAA